jgi:hypothetical protein
VINRIKMARWAVVGGVVLTVGAAAGAATRMKQRWSAGDACLCTPDTQDPVGFGSVARATTGTPSYTRGGVGTAAIGSSAGAGPLAAVLAATTPSFWNDRAVVASSGNAGGVGWTDRVKNVGAYSGGSNHRVGALGGLWRLMSLRGHPSSNTSAKVTSSSHKQSSSSPKKGSGGSHSGSGPGAPVVMPSPAMPPLFANQLIPLPDLLGAGGTIPGIGAGVGHGAGGGGSLATTPEPGSIFLLGTGALGLLGVLRRRRMQ